jgi:predicted DNA-binding transcriptional regulator AlpA
VAGDGAGGLGDRVLCPPVWFVVVCRWGAACDRGYSVHYASVVTMKLIRLIIWAALAIASASFGIAIARASGNKTEAALVFVITTLAVGRTVKISFQPTRSKLLNKREVALFFGVSKRTVDVWLLDGKLPKPRRRFGLRRWELDKIRALRK